MQLKLYSIQLQFNSIIEEDITIPYLNSWLCHINVCSILIPCANTETIGGDVGAVGARTE